MRHIRFFDGVIQNSDSDTDLPNDDNAGADRGAKLDEPRFYSAVQSWFNRSRDITELWVLAKDRSGLFADLTKALASCGASISGAQLHTAQSGQVMNVFYLHGGDGRAFGQGSEHQIETLRRRALRAARGEPQDIIIPKDLPSRRSGAIPVKPQVKFLDHASNQQSIVEIQGRDRAGLLYQIAHIFDEEGLDVKSAHIEVVGTQAIDAFYVRDRASDSLLSPAMQARLQQKLFAILDNKNASSKRSALPKPAATAVRVDKV